MLKHIAILSSLSLPLFTAGCFNTASNEVSGASVASWQMPWQLDPISRRSAAYGERIFTAYVPGAGRVRGTRQALASIGHALPQGPGPNRTVETCRRTVAGAAARYGGKQVEAASAGPDHLDAQGDYAGRVLIRVNYRRPWGYEVREAVLTCIVSPTDKIVNAYAAGSRRGA